MKNAIVTGANRGLGLATAEGLAKKGYRVILTARDPEKLQKVCSELKETGLEVESCPLDVSSRKSVEEFKDFVKGKFQKLDVLVNNAGICPDRSAAEGDELNSLSTSPEIVLDTFQTNSLGPYRLIQALISLLKKSEAARIVNVSSGMGQLSEMGPTFPAYRLSKTALNALTRMLHAEFEGTPIKINSVCPGWVRTDMGGANATRSLEEGASGILWAATLPDDGPSGGFFRDAQRIDW